MTPEEKAAIVALLRAMEFAGPQDVGGDGYYSGPTCLACGGDRHRHDCALVACLKVLEREEHKP